MINYLQVYWLQMVERQFVHIIGDRVKLIANHFVIVSLYFIFVTLKFSLG